MKHPAAQDALRYILSRSVSAMDSWIEIFSKNDDELSIRCWKTLHSLLNKREVEDIDILGLAYVMKQGECG